MGRLVQMYDSGAGNATGSPFPGNGTGSPFFTIFHHLPANGEQWYMLQMVKNDAFASLHHFSPFPKQML
jgi:hypothetical protein